VRENNPGKLRAAVVAFGGPAKIYFSLAALHLVEKVRGIQGLTAVVGEVLESHLAPHAGTAMR
jgi:hypothetical protein